MAEQKAWLCNGEPLLLLKEKEMEDEAKNKPRKREAYE
jgi:hypothetical protein